MIPFIAPKLNFPCQPQSMVDFISEVIKRQGIVQLNYQDGAYIRYGYKDLLWDTSNPDYPLLIQGEGRFNPQGYEEHYPETWVGPHRLISIELVEGWVA